MRKHCGLASSFNLWISASTSYNFHDSSWHESRLSKVQKSNPNKKKCIQILIQTLQTQTLALQNSLDMIALILKRLNMLFLFKKFWKESTFLPEKSRWTPKSKMWAESCSEKTAEVSYFKGNCWKLLNIYDNFIPFQPLFKILIVEKNCMDIYRKDF